VVVRDAVGNPSVNAYVTLSFNYLSYIYCPPPKFCPIQEPGTWINGSGVNRTTDGSGTVTFHLAVGGLCPSATVYVTANGVPLGDLPVVNFDQDGDLQVTAADQALASAKVGGTDPSADFDCSGAVDSTDMTLLASHVGHTCDATTPVTRRSWGAIKSIYR